MREHEVSAAQTLRRNLHELPILRASVGSTESDVAQPTSVCRTNGTSISENL